MVLFQRKVFIILAVVLISAIVGLGYFSYVKTGGSAGEWLLFWHIVVATAAALGFLIILLRSIQLSRQLDNLIAMSKQRGFSPEASMRKLGILGEKITLLYFELESLSEKKTLKIGSQRDLIDFLSSIVHERLLITDVTGRVLYASRSFSESIPGGKAEHIDKGIEDLIPGLSFESVVGELTRKHVPVDVNVDGKDFSFHPVFNRRTDLGYVVACLDKIHIIQTPSTLSVAEAYQRVTIQERIRRLISR